VRPCTPCWFTASGATFPTAFVAYNCLMAAGAIKALHREGWQVPADLSVVGADAPRAQAGDALSVTGAGTDPSQTR
jgi:DNA-binding LacI/PurR family transcriptional regulator